MLFRVFALVALVLLPSLADAQFGRRRNHIPPAQFAHQIPPAYTGKDSSDKDALAEVNAARARYGLKPFVNDKLLNQAAQAAAKYRAAHRISGHVPGGRGDFQFVPAGGEARAAGCAAWNKSDGWGSCCTYDTGYTYAGAAWAIGSDGKRYMHLFCR